MAQRQKDKKPQVEEEEPEEASSEAEEGSEDAPARVSAPDDALAEAGASEGGALAEGDELAETDEEQGAAQLGTERYVLAGFFAAGMLGAYVLGRFLQALWASASNKDWFSQSVPTLAAVADDDKGTISLVLGGLIALVVVIRTYRKPDVRAWTDEVASELTKVKWPSRKEVTNSTIIVIAASTVATVYLALLDRFWAFVTSLVYGDGS